MIKKINNYSVIGIVGLAKNTGKTTTLNYILDHLDNNKIGLTSIGLDGESFDQITYLPKPSIYVSPGMVVATAKDVLNRVNFKYEILEETNLKTALGVICIIQILSKGQIILAGPTTNKDLEILIKTFKKYVNQILIDGAFNRKTFASIESIEAIILATGAALSKDMNETIQKTKQIVSSFNLPMTNSYIEKTHHMAIITKKGVILFNKKDMDEILTYQKHVEAIEFKGALTSKMVNYMVMHKMKNFNLIIEDPTKIMIDHNQYEHLNQLGVKLFVLNQVPIIALTINPFSPSGHHYDKSIFYQEIKKQIDIDIYNVKEMGS